MQFDDQIRRYFGVDDLVMATPAAIESGIDRIQVDLGLATDPTRRFALWTFLYMLGAAPALDSVFEDAGERDAARNFMDLIDRQAADDD